MSTKRVSWMPKMLCGLLTVLGLTACGSLGTGSGSSLIERDIYDMKTKLDRSLEEQASSDRKVDYRLTAIEESLSGRNATTTNAIDDLEKRLREQTQELTAIRSELEKVTFALDRLGKQNVTATPQAGAATDAAPGTGATNTAADQAYETALHQFNLGNFAPAREGFRQALEQNPVGDKKIEMLFWMAESCFKLGDYEAANDSYYKLILENRSHPKAWVGLERMADIKIEQGDKPRALSMLNQIVQLNASYPDIERVKAKVAQLQGTTPAPSDDRTEPESQPTTTQPTQP